VATAALMGGGILLAGAATAGASATTYGKAFEYQFTSTNSASQYSPGFMSEQPITDAEATQSVGAEGVTLSIDPQQQPGTACCDAGVLVDMGPLSNLFTGSGSSTTLRPFAITGTGKVFTNWIFGTNGKDQPLDYSSGKLVDNGGDNYAYGSQTPLTLTSTGVNVSDTADFVTLMPQPNTSFSGVTTLEAVYQKFQAGQVSATAPRDPEVWMNVLVFGNTAQTTQTATVSSIDGLPLTQSFSPAGEIWNAYSGKCLDVTGGVYGDGTHLQQWTCGADGGAHQQFQIVDFSNGASYLETVGPSGTGPWCVAANADQTNAHATVQECGNGAGGQAMAKSGPFYRFPDSTNVLDDSGYSKVNGTYVITHAQNTTNSLNQQWSLP
jgi:hypothetical protein